VQRPEGHAEIAACVDPRHQGAGYATAATRELVAYGIEELRLNRIKAGAVASNERSRTVLERVGFTETLTQRQEKRVDGEFVDVVAYSMLAADWFDRPETTRGIPDSPPGATAEARGHENPFAVEPRDDDADEGGDR
jgi:RimJ/RimL family protein N-acetyltransferase